MPELLLLGIFGLIVGSFLNVIIYRLPRELEWVHGRSMCPACKESLRWYELIPLISWIVLRGKCSRCKTWISVVYPLVEIMNSVLWMGVGWIAWGGGQLAGFRWGQPEGMGWSWLGLILLLVFCSTLIVIFWVDWFHYIIPDSTVIIVIAVGLLLGVMQWWGGGGASGLWERGLWGLGSLAFFGLLYLLTKGKGMGLGDVKLVLGLGLVLGTSMSVALMGSFIMGAIVGLVMLGLKMRKLGQPIPFGPFLVIGTLVGLIGGDRIVQWYLGGL